MNKTYSPYFHSLTTCKVLYSGLEGTSNDVFGNDDWQNAFHPTNPAGMLIVPTTQRAQVDLVGIGATVEQEKDNLLEKVCHG